VNEDEIVTDIPLIPAPLPTGEGAIIKRYGRNNSPALSLRERVPREGGTGEGDLALRSERT